MHVRGRRLQSQFLTYRLLRRQGGKCKTCTLADLTHRQPARREALGRALREEFDPSAFGEPVRGPSFGALQRDGDKQAGAGVGRGRNGRALSEIGKGREGLAADEDGGVGDSAVVFAPGEPEASACVRVPAVAEDSAGDGAAAAGGLRDDREES